MAHICIQKPKSAKGEEHKKSEWEEAKEKEKLEPLIQKLRTYKKNHPDLINLEMEDLEVENIYKSMTKQGFISMAKNFIEKSFSVKPQLCLFNEPFRNIQGMNLNMELYLRDLDWDKMDITTQRSLYTFIRVL